AHHVPVLLHEQRVRLRRVHGDAVHAVADLGGRVGQLVFRHQALAHRLPALTAVLGAERAAGRDGDEHAVLLLRVDEAGVQAHAAGAGLPQAALHRAQRGQLAPRLAAVRGLEHRRVLDARVHDVGVAGRRLQPPHALELPWMLRAVVPLVRAGHAVVRELVVHRLPRPAGIVRALDHLAEPAAGLRGVEPVRVRGRTAHVVDLPAGEVWTGDLPLLA